MPITQLSKFPFMKTIITISPLTVFAFHIQSTPYASLDILLFLYRWVFVLLCVLILSSMYHHVHLSWFRALIPLIDLLLGEAILLHPLYRLDFWYISWKFSNFVFIDSLFLEKNSFFEFLLIFCIGCENPGGILRLRRKGIQTMPLRSRARREKEEGHARRSTPYSGAGHQWP